MGVRIAWVDSSAEQQRRMREIAGLFSERGTQEELGLSSLRDGLADLLFPGTSTLHTRARYLLFVPWCYRIAQDRGGEGSLEDTVRRLEHILISRFPQDADREGLIGARAGTAVKGLPSSLYWGMLTTHRILLPPHSPAAQALVLDREAEDMPAMLVARGMPPPPPGFPHQIPGGFALEPAEASWLQDALQISAPDSALAQLLRIRPDPTSPTVWEDPAALRMPDPARSQLQVAEQFSRFMHGAQLLYNLLLGEAHQDLHARHGTTPEGLPAQAVDLYRQELVEWFREVPDIEDWDTSELLETVRAGRGRALPPGVVDFVRRWHAACLTAGPDGVADHETARELVEGRERRLKGPQSRFRNPRLLAEWSGASGRGRMSMRWETVRRVLTDIWEGVPTDAPS